MIAMYVMAVVVVVGVVGGVASVHSYEQLYNQKGSGMRIPRHSRRTRQRSRPSRQLQAVEAALAEDAATDQPTRCSPVRAHGRWTRGE
jgi:hypothetical protein